MKNGIFEFCVSTILDRRKLEEYAVRGRGAATEGRAWKTAQILLEKAKKAGEKMPVIFSDAAYNADHLLVWAILQKIEIEDDRTSIQFNEVERVRWNHHRTELKLRSTGDRIADNFIRPYAICLTPPFLK